MDSCCFKHKYLPSLAPGLTEGAGLLPLGSPISSFWGQKQPQDKNGSLVIHLHNHTSVLFKLGKEFGVMPYPCHSLLDLTLHFCMTISPRNCNYP